MTEPPKLEDLDPVETREWLESIDSVLKTHGAERAHFLLERLIDYTRRSGAYLPFKPNTAYVNSIPTGREPEYPGNRALERRIEAYIRWNALAMVLQANKKSSEYGGHLASYASSATLYEVGFNHVWRAPSEQQPGDMVFIQGHSSPGIYARAFLEGRLTEEQLRHFRQEAGGPGTGLSSYPHPWLMPDFWQFPTVSMGLGPMMAIFQARFTRYLEHRGLVKPSDQKVWAFLGDGEMDEPESMGALTMPVREGLDNLIFVINCNLQRLDGPVRGNGKIIQELEAAFRGAGWNVIKVIWGREWDDLLARDVDGVLVNKMNTTNDGQFQKYSTESGAYIREHFFGPDPRLQRMVAQLSDEDLTHLRRGGHDYRKLYAAYKLATEYEGAPTVILAHTIKGWALGPGFTARNSTHQIKKMSDEELKAFRDTLELPITDRQLEQGTPPYYHPGDDSEEVEYLRVRRRMLHGPVPRRVVRARPLPLLDEAIWKEPLAGSGTRAASTTMAFAAILRSLLRDKQVGQRVVPIIPDEARTFGMDGLFREVKIYAPFGQQYEPVDANMVLSYREASDGQILEEGITEAGAMASFTAAGTAYATHGQPMIPFYIFYSMFGFQRVGDLVWAFGDSRGRGFLLGATAGRTTLNGEGLQHEDGHSPLLFSVVPNVRIYDPAFAYELAVVIRDGMRRMYTDGEDVFYYITLYNENHAMPPMPEGVEEGVLRGLYRYQAAAEPRRHRVHILASGTAMLAALEAQQLLAEHHDVAADVWSATSYQQLRNEALDVERWNRLHPQKRARVPYVTGLLAADPAAVVAVTDYVKAVPEQVARFIPGSFTVLGTDGYGRSDTRDALRRHFETDAAHIVVAVLAALGRDDLIDPAVVSEAMDRYRIDPETPTPALT